MWFSIYFNFISVHWNTGNNLDSNRKKFLTVRVVRHWNMLSRAVVDAPTLEVSEARPNVAMSNLVFWKIPCHGRMLKQDDLLKSFLTQTIQWFYDSHRLRSICFRHLLPFLARPGTVCGELNGSEILYWMVFGLLLSPKLQSAEQVFKCIISYVKECKGVGAFQETGPLYHHKIHFGKSF